MKIAAVAVVIGVRLGTFAWAAGDWVETGAKIDEVVAETGMPAPPSQLRPLAAEIPFAGFRYPPVDDEENVTFIADGAIYTDGGKNHGIYRSLATRP